MFTYSGSVGRFEMPRKATPRPESKVRMDGCLGPAEFGTAYVQRWKKAREKGDPVSLLLLDLDGLHELNTAHGHEEGDRALNATIAALGKAAKAEGWLLGRIGGDEFALVAPAVGTEAGFLRADSLRREVDAALAKAIQHGRCTASIGVASTPRDAKAPDELMRKADLALYAAK